MSEPTTRPGESDAVAAMDTLGLEHRIVRHGKVASAEEAAAARGVEVRDLIKTIVVRRGDDDFLFILVPGDRAISWPKLRTHLGVSRLSLPDAAEALNVTGYERGTITPFGATTAWPVICDEYLLGRTVAIGAGAHGVAAIAQCDDIVRVLSATVADVTE